LGIRHLGEQTAVDLADNFNNLDKLRKMEKQKIEAISGIGPKTSQSVFNWFKLNFTIFKKIKKNYTLAVTKKFNTTLNFDIENSQT
jgi:NAD-dependent DNA ligase